MTLKKLIAALRDSAALCYHNGRGSAKVFPFLIGFGWRDEVGFNPGVIYWVHQIGAPDPYLLPYGHRSVMSSWHLFGSRTAPQESVT